MRSIGKCAVVCAVLFAAGTLVAQGPPIGGGGSGALGLTVPDVAVEPGETFTLSVHLDHPDPVNFMILFMNTDPANVQFMSWAPGEGLQAYINAIGVPPQCDVMVDPFSFFGLMMLPAPGFDSSIYGTEFYVVTCVANGPEGAYPIDFTADSPVGTTAGTATVTIGDPGTGTGDPEKLMRGDVDDSGSCDVADAINLLGHLFGGSFTPNCLDASDVDDDGSVNIADAVNLLSGLFGGGFILDDSCAEDTTADPLGTCDRENCI